MHGHLNFKTHEEYIAADDEKRRDDIQGLHDLIRETVRPSSNPPWSSA